MSRPKGSKNKNPYPESAKLAIGNANKGRVHKDNCQCESKGYKFNLIGRDEIELMRNFL